MNKVLVVDDLMYAWGLRCAKCSALQYLLTMNFTRPWYICMRGIGSLSIWVSCSLNVVGYLGSMECASMPKNFHWELGEDVLGYS